MSKLSIIKLSNMSSYLILHLPTKNLRESEKIYLKSKAPIVQSLANQKTSTTRNISQKCPVSTPLVTTWMQDICYRHWKSYLQKTYPKGSLPLSLDLEKDKYYD
jgi:hypothetical protein